MKIFLGGTCNGSTWRDDLIRKLNTHDYFNPVVANWTPECMAEELRQRAMAEYVVYVITPLMTGVYSIAEVVDDSNKRPEKTILCILENDYDFIKDEVLDYHTDQRRSLDAVKKMVQNNGGTVCATLKELARYLNERVWDRKQS